MNGNTVDVIKHYKIEKCKNCFRITNTKDTSKHTHLKSLKACYKVINCLINNKVPHEPYLRESCIRLSDNVKYKNTAIYINEKKKQKQVFRNYNLYPGKYGRF